MNTNLLFIKKCKILFLFGILFLSGNAFSSYYSNNFLSSKFVNYLSEYENGILLITKNNEAQNYNVKDFKKKIFSELYNNGNFIIYINEKFLNEECIKFFQFFYLEECDNQEYQFLIDDVIEKTGVEYYKYTDTFKRFIFYHEFAHLLIHNKWGGYYKKREEFMADLIALDMLWYFHKIDFRENLSVFRENQVYFKSRFEYKLYEDYKTYKFVKDLQKKDINKWLDDILFYTGDFNLTSYQANAMKKKINEINRKISEVLAKYILKRPEIDIKKYFGFINQKSSLDNSLIDNVHSH